MLLYVFCFSVTACLSPEELDDTLMQLESGVDLALERAKVWSKYAKDVICYVEKRIHLGRYRRHSHYLSREIKDGL